MNECIRHFSPQSTENRSSFTILSEDPLNFTEEPIINFDLNSFSQNSFSHTLRSGDASTENVNLPSQATANWSSSTLRSEETLNSSTLRPKESHNTIQQKQKRGRKPKGGKIKTKEPDDKKNTKVITNIILHLKCSTTDLNKFNATVGNLSINLLEYNPNIPPDIMTYNNNFYSFCSENLNDCVNNLYPFENEHRPNKNLNCKSIENGNIKNKPAYQQYISPIHLKKNTNNLPSHTTENWSSSTLLYEENINYSPRIVDENQFPSRAKENGDSSTLCSDKSLKFCENKVEEKMSNFTERDVEENSTICEEKNKITFLENTFSKPKILNSKKNVFGSGDSFEESHFPSQSTENGYFSTLRSDESLNFASTSFPQNLFLHTLRSGENINSSKRSVEEDQIDVACEGNLMDSSVRSVEEYPFSVDYIEKVEKCREIPSCRSPQRQLNFSELSNYLPSHATVNWPSSKLRSNESLNSPTLRSGENVKPNEEKLLNKEINTKIKQLKIGLYKNTKQNKKSACFWCTYDFDNPPCYIPKYENDKSIVGYGSFCTPECASAYLMNESLDDSTKFERYHLLNKVYAKIYNYSKNINPAPNPYYLLDKYYGNLTIQEYRKILKSGRTFIILEKPFTRFLPELHEDNEDIGLNYNSNCKELTNDNFITNNNERFIIGSGYNFSSVLPSQATANWSSSTLRSEESINSFPQNSFSETRYSGENSNFSKFHTEKNIFGSGDASTKNVNLPTLCSGENVNFEEHNNFSTLHLPSQSTANGSSSMLNCNESIKSIKSINNYLKNPLETRKVNGFENFASSPFCEDKVKSKDKLDSSFFPIRNMENSFDCINYEQQNINTRTSGIYKVKKQTEKVNEMSKTSIIKRLFA